MPYHIGYIEMVSLFPQYFHMPFKITYPRETLATILTLICFLLYVYCQMAFKITFLWESLMALAAFKKYWLITISWESLLPLTTNKWFLPSVWHHISFKIISLWESLTTMGAMVWFLPSVFADTATAFRAWKRHPAYIFT